MEQRTEPVNHPSHYGGDVEHEVIKCLKAWGLESDALLWNAAKYISRSAKKGRQLEDLKKARFYLDRRISSLEGEIGGWQREVESNVKSSTRRGQRKIGTSKP